MAAREENLQSDLRSKRVKKTVYKGNKYTIKKAWTNISKGSFSFKQWILAWLRHFSRGRGGGGSVGTVPLPAILFCQKEWVRLAACLKNNTYDYKCPCGDKINLKMPLNLKFFCIRAVQNQQKSGENVSIVSLTRQRSNCKHLPLNFPIINILSQPAATRKLHSILSGRNLYFNLLHKESWPISSVIMA